MLLRDVTSSFHRESSHWFLKIMLSTGAMGWVSSRVPCSRGITRGGLFTITAVECRRRHMLWCRIMRLAIVQRLMKLRLVMLCVVLLIMDLSMVA